MASTPYSTGRGRGGVTERAINEARQALSDHAADQWDARTPETSISPERALAHATRDTGLLAWLRRHTNHANLPEWYHGDDELRALHIYRGVTAARSQYSVVFLEARSGGIMTVIRLEQASGVGPLRQYLASQTRTHDEGRARS